MNDTNLKMLSILGAAIHDQNTEKVSHDEWVAILKEMKAHAVHALPASQVFSLGLESKDYLAYLSLFGQNIQRFHIILNAQCDILLKLRAAGLHPVVLKGMASAAYYPHPELRTPGDIDLIVPPEELRQAYEIICSSGYEPSNPYENRHISFSSPDNLEIELHRYFSSTNDESINLVVDNFVFSGLAACSFVTVCGEAVPSLPPLSLGIVLLSHINQHIWDGLGLRQIIDWLFFAEKELTDAYWNETFEKAAQSVGFKRLAIVVTAMCQKYLGLSPTITWCTLEESDSAADELIDYILNCGNFGKKDAKLRKNIEKVRLLNNPLRLFQKAQETGVRNWEACHRHHWLKPFAWVHQGFVWFGHLIRDRFMGKKYRQYRSKEKEETALMAQIGAVRRK